MRFQCAGSFEEGVADIDPVAAPETALSNHILRPQESVTKNPKSLFLALAGSSTETLTVSLYLLVEDKGIGVAIGDYIAAGTRWLPFATGVVVTNGELQTVTADLPAGGTIYVRRTGDTITSGQTRKLLAAWVDNA